MPNPYPNDSLQKLQETELEILQVIDTLCRNHHIDYFIDGGTCLGAIRHGGFIPWDDDIDIGMPQKDYERFCEIAPHELPDGYSLHSSSNTKGFSALWVKVFKDNTRFIDDNALEAGCDQGIFVDIFPFYQLDSNEEEAKKQCSRVRWIQIKSYLKHFSRPKLPSGIPFRPLVKLGCKFVHYTVAKLWRQSTLQEKFDHAFDTNTPGSRWVSAAYPHEQHDERTIFPISDIEFNGLIVRVPHDCNRYCTDIYGNWHQLPPIKQRYTHAPQILDFGNGANVIDA